MDEFDGTFKVLVDPNVKAEKKNISMTDKCTKLSLLYGITCVRYILQS